MSQLQRKVAEVRRGCRGGEPRKVVLIVAMVFILALYLIHLIYYDPRLGTVSSSHGGVNGRSIIERKDKEMQRECVKAVKEDDVVGKKQDDPQLIQYLQRRFLPPAILPYNLSNPNKTHYAQSGQNNILDENFLHGMTGGVFVEAGAVDGEYLSNTLYLEKHLGWTGILIEPIPSSYAMLRKKNRRAYSINVALAITNSTSLVDLSTRGTLSRILRVNSTREGQDQEQVKKPEVTVLSVPLYSLLLALNVKQVDFLSLDVEGAELGVFKTVPWEKLKVRVMCVECNKVKPSDLTSLLTSVGYIHLGNFGIDCWYGWPSLLNETLRNSTGNSNSKKKA